MNRLGQATSPYLRQHADNPVAWHEWGQEAFAEARERDVPVFLSVGYSSCHWCHVMAHESFEDPATAEVLNARFVSVKVDREERPDVDAVYMDAVQAMTGHGGWPMSVFLTPQGVPFFAGTYWPAEERAGLPSFVRVLEAVGEAWEHQRDEVEASTARIRAHLEGLQRVEDAGDVADASLAAEAAAACVRAWDSAHGGFGGAPKFPMAMTIDFLLAHHVRTGDEGALRAATHSLEAMARGGIHDQVGGGFHRYAVDDTWLVPHFEKMLYDNALLLRAYTHAWQVTGQPRWRRVAEGIADYLLREMRDPAGGLYSATDADSEGVEGKYFTWTLEEFTEVVAATGQDPAWWAEHFGVREGGNFEGASILHRPGAGGEDDDDADLAARRARVAEALRARRETRVPPGLDDKVLASWNGLALGALAEAGAALGRRDYVDAAAGVAEFLRGHLVVDGRLRHAWTARGGASGQTFAEDLADLAQGLLALAEAVPDPTWVGWAAELATEAEARHADPEGGGYFATADDGEALLTRPKELWDNATPAPSSVMADVGLQLAALTGEATHHEAAQRVLRRFAGRAAQAPTGHGELLRALERDLAPTREVAVVGAPDDPAFGELLAVARERWRPGDVLAAAAPGDQAVPLLADRGLVEGRPAAYVCRDFACSRPVTDPADLRALLDEAA
ncbi:MAG: thioredoxin domain-containing protein [Actinomycetota bacterium]